MLATVAAKDPWRLHCISGQRSWLIDAMQPPCATAHWHGGGWVVGRPPAVGLPSCLHAATGMEEVGWWGDPREGFILTKPCDNDKAATFFFSDDSGGARAPPPGSAASLG